MADGIAYELVRVRTRDGDETTVYLVRHRWRRRGRRLDGGGSATLVHRGHLLNRPYSSQDQPAPASRPVVTALLFER